MSKTVAIVGSRDYPDLDQVERFTRGLAQKYPDIVLYSGGARGVDRKAEETAQECGLLVRSYRPTQKGDHYEIVVWQNDRAGNPLRPGMSCRDAGAIAKTFLVFRDAAFARNGYIVSWSDSVVAFWTGESTGTRDTLQRAKHLDVPYYIYEPQGLWEPERAACAISGRSRTSAPESAPASS